MDDNILFFLKIYVFLIKLIEVLRLYHPLNSYAQHILMGDQNCPFILNSPTFAESSNLHLKDIQL